MSEKEAFSDLKKPWRWIRNAAKKSSGYKGFGVTGGGMLHAESKDRHMIRQFVRTSILVISFTFLYYGVAWSVLRCVHDEDSNYDVTFVGNDPVHLDLECVCPNFHTEAMATASSPSQGDHLSRAVTRYVNDCLALQTRRGNAGSDAWLRAVFEMSPSLAFLTGLPSYLFFSILRI